MDANTNSGFHSRLSAFIRGSFTLSIRIEIEFDDSKRWYSPRTVLNAKDFVTSQNVPETIVNLKRLFLELTSYEFYHHKNLITE